MFKVLLFIALIIWILSRFFDITPKTKPKKSKD